MEDYFLWIEEEPCNPSLFYVCCKRDDVRKKEMYKDCTPLEDCIERLEEYGLVHHSFKTNPDFIDNIKRGLPLDDFVNWWVLAFEEISEKEMTQCLILLIGAETYKSGNDLYFLSFKIRDSVNNSWGNLDYHIYEILSALRSDTYFALNNIWYSGESGSTYNAFCSLIEAYDLEDCSFLEAKEIFEGTLEYYDTHFNRGGCNPHFPDEYWVLIDMIT